MTKSLLLKKTSFFTLLFFTFFQFIFSQVPPDNLSGEDLKLWLQINYYDGKHVTLGYSNARMYMYNYIDNENGVITCVYSGYQVNSPYGGTTTYPAPINCEHTIPQSFFNEADPMVSDIFHLYPSYEVWNSTRSNYPFSEINDSETTKWMYLDLLQTSIPSSNIDYYSEYANLKFEPREDHKGNVARSIFYFYTMYPTEAGGISQIGDINTFYQWHLADPVDAAELERNNQIEIYQGNRNPYIDHPELIARAWGFTPVNTVPSTPALQLASNSTSLNLTWANVSDENGYKLYRSTNGSSYSFLADISANTTAYSDTAVSEGTTYYYYVLAYNTYGNSSNSNVVSGSLNTSSGGIATELLFSEYIEGSSYNKALEIANFTGTDVALSNYTIRKQTNGAGDWGSPLTLTGTLTNGGVYVVANTSANTTIQSVADILTGVDALSFNGNDAIGLFKNGTLIDIIGVFNSSANFAIDVTLVRNPDILSPNTTYSTSEWTSYPIDTFSNLGTHTIDGGGTPVADTQAPTAPANLIYANITTSSVDLSWTASTDNVGVTEYNIYQNGIYIGSSVTTGFTVNGLAASTTYSFSVKAKDAAGNTSASSNSVTITTVSLQITYCDSYGNDTNDEWIKQVIIADINNTSGDNNGYGDYTNVTANVTAGNSYSVTIYPGFSGRSYKEVYKVWIDYNHDGTFDTTTETAFSISSKNTLVSGTFTVPSNAVTGLTRMRVAMKYNVASTPCEVFAYGEVEDYTVNISSGALARQTNLDITHSDLKIKLYPNPATDFANLRLTVNSDTNLSYRVVDLQGRVVLSKNDFQVSGMQEERLDVSALKSGVYLVMIYNNEVNETQKLIVK